VLDDQVGTTTVYVGSGICRICAQALTPVEVAYNGDVCTTHKRAAVAALVQNKRVGDLR
jgi:hypothetical protein